MMKKSISLALRGAVLVALAAAFTANATQTVQPVKDTAGTAFSGNSALWTASVPVGTVVTVIGRYSTNNTGGSESGLGLKVKYDETKFTAGSVTVTALNTKCMIAPPQVQSAGAASQAVLGWIDTAIRTPAGTVGWPYLADPSAPNGCLSPNTPANDTTVTADPVNLFRFQATLAPGVTVASTTDITITADGNYSYAGPATPGMADQLVRITAAPAPTIGLLSVATTRIHNDGTTTVTAPLAHTATGASAAGIAAAAAGAGITVEPRGGTAHTVVMTFNSAPTAGTATVVSCIVPDPVNPAPAFLPCASNPTVGVVTFDAVTLTATIPLNGVTNQSRVQIRLSNVNGQGIDGDVAIGFLRGDADRNGIVQGGDVNFTQLRLGLSPTNTATFGTSAFRADNDANGVVQGGDVNAAQLRLGTRLP